MEKRFLIVGLGLLGGRYAMGLARAGFAVDGADTDPAAVAYALEKGYIRQGRCGSRVTSIPNRSSTGPASRAAQRSRTLACGPPNIPNVRRA